MLVIGSGAAGLTAALNLAPNAQGGGARQGRARRGRDRLGAGRDRRGARGRRQVRSHVEDTMIAGAGLNDRAVVEHVVVAARRRRSSGWPSSACRSTPSEDGDALAPDPRGRPQPPPHRPCRRRHRLGGAAGAGEGRGRATPTSRLVPDMVAIDLVTGRHAADFSTSGAVHGLYAFNRATGRVETLDRARDHPGDRRRGPRLSLFDRAARRDRRRHRHGVARRLPRLEHGIHAVPPDLPLQSRGQEFPDHRGGARRGRACCKQPRDRPPLHARLRRARRAGAARHRRPRDRP